MDFAQILGNFGFDWRIALANLVNFLIIVWILNYFAFKPINQKIKEREEKVKKGLEDAKKASSELQMAEQNSQETLLKARNEANKIIAQAQNESEKIIADAKLFQEEQTKNIIAKAEKAIQQEKQKMIQDLKKEVVDLVFVVAKKFIKNESTKEKQEEVIKRILKDNEL
jgi:F-type H+-transporting ATPase subunit b